MDISIIIVSWNVREHLQRCLASIERAAGDLMFEVFVVDNVSTDGTRELLVTSNWQRAFETKKARSQEPGARSFHVIQNDVNRGFAAANNQAMRQAKGEYILLLNPDTELTPTNSPHRHQLLFSDEAGSRQGRDLHKGEGSACRSGREGVEAMLHFMQSHPRCGILGPKLLNTDGTLQRSVRRFPDAWSPILSSLGVTPKRYLAMDFDYTKTQQADQVMGACFLIRRELLQEIGLLDKKFFIWFEEVDYCKRAKDAGWEVWYTPDVSVTHHGGESFGQVATLKKQWMYSKSLLQYFWKHGQWFAVFVNAIALPFRLILSIILRLLRRARNDNT